MVMNKWYNNGSKLFYVQSTAFLFYIALCQHKTKHNTCTIRYRIASYSAKLLEMSVLIIPQVNNACIKRNHHAL